MLKWRNNWRLFSFPVMQINRRSTNISTKCRGKRCPTQVRLVLVMFFLAESRGWFRSWSIDIGVREVSGRWNSLFNRCFSFGWSDQFQRCRRSKCWIWQSFDSLVSGPKFILVSSCSWWRILLDRCDLWRMFSSSIGRRTILVFEWRLSIEPLWRMFEKTRTFTSKIFPSESTLSVWNSSSIDSISSRSQIERKDRTEEDLSVTTQSNRILLFCTLVSPVSSLYTEISRTLRTTARETTRIGDSLRFLWSRWRIFRATSPGNALASDSATLRTTSQRLLSIRWWVQNILSCRTVTVQVGHYPF